MISSVEAIFMNRSPVAFVMAACLPQMIVFMHKSAGWLSHNSFYGRLNRLSILNIDPLYHFHPTKAPTITVTPLQGIFGASLSSKL